MNHDNGYVNEMMKGDSQGLFTRETQLYGLLTLEVLLLQIAPATQVLQGR